MKLKYGYFGFVLFLAITCGSGNETDQSIEELTFVVNDSLLGPAFTDSTLLFTFHPPIGCERVPDSTMLRVKDKIFDMMAQQEGIEVIPVGFFINRESGSACCLSRLSGMEANSRIFDTFREYKSLLKDKFPDARIDEGAFRVNDINVFQYLISNNERVIFKLLCYSPKGRTFQLDYIVPRSMYHQHVKAIESSIGSFKMLP